MKTHPFDTPTFYITSPSFRYSVNEIKRLVATRTIDPETAVHSLDGQPFTAGLIVAVNSTAISIPTA